MLVMSEYQPDPVISDAVHMISNRFGVQGLADLIALAHEELEKAETALRELSERG
jgi:hypothetical protein